MRGIVAKNIRALARSGMKKKDARKAWFAQPKYNVGRTEPKPIVIKKRRKSSFKGLRPQRCQPHYDTVGTPRNRLTSHPHATIVVRQMNVFSGYQCHTSRKNAYRGITFRRRQEALKESLQQQIIAHVTRIKSTAQRKEPKVYPHSSVRQQTRHLRNTGRSA